MRRLLPIAAAAAAVYLLLALFWPDRSHRTLREVISWGSIGALAALHLAGRRAAAGAGRGTVLLAGGIVAFAALAPAVLHSSDVEAYANLGWQQARYGLDPYAEVPSDLADPMADPMFAGQWLDTPGVYGPLFCLYARGVAGVSGGDRELAIRLFQLGNLVALALTAWLLVRAGRSAEELWLFLAAPVILLHLVTDAHNDALVGLFLLGSLVAARSGRWPLVLPALAAAALVKVAVAVAAPFLLLYLWRRHGPTKALASAFLALALAAACFAPYLSRASEWRTSEIASILSTPANSIQAVVFYVAKPIVRAVSDHDGALEAVRTGLGWLFAAGFLLLLGRRFLRSARRPEYGPDAVTADVLVAVVVLLAVASAKFYGWYLGTWLPAALLLGRTHPLRRLTEWMMVFVLLAFTFVGRTRILDGLAMVAIPLVLAWRRLLPPGVTLPAGSTFDRES